MKRPGVLRRTTELRSKVRLHRKPRHASDRVTPALAAYVFARDSYRCIASRFDTSHRCEGRLTFEHVPLANENAMGRRAKSDRWHGVAACLGAQQGWCLTHREEERAWLAAVEPLPAEEGTDALTVNPV
jgi:hypothetical protein